MDRARFLEIERERLQTCRRSPPRHVEGGYRRTDVDRCLADNAMATRLAQISAREWDRPGVDSTPSFAINGVVMPGTHTWAALERQIKEFL